MATFLLELGTEELPAPFVNSAIKQWEQIIPTSLTENSLTNIAIHVYGTPRRLAVLIKGLPLQQADRVEEIKGPPVSSAFKEGKPTPAAEGFAKKQGVDINSLEIRPTEKGEFVFVRRHIPGRLTADILVKLVHQWINKLEGKRLMRWGDGDLKFSRPIRWLVSLLDDQVLPISLVSGSELVESDRISQGHRVLHPQPIPLEKADHYVETLRSAFIEVVPEQRQISIEEQIKTLAKTVEGSAEIPQNLLKEVTNLVEWPTAVLGKFDEQFLGLPPEVIKMVMISHQRYFPILKHPESGELLPYFITISNGDPAKSEIISAGNVRVIRARLADGEYFYKTDSAHPLESYLPQLETVTFQEDLGTVRDKVTRIQTISQLIADQLEVNPSQREMIERAALLCKADLVTQMVYEFPELQGIMGQNYALLSGEREFVSQAIFEHYLPRGAGDILPQTLIGQVVGLADRLDTLVGIFGLGMLPTGSSDPFALRRAANAIINITWSAQFPLNLQQLLQQIVHNFLTSHPQGSPQLLNQVCDFFLQRIRTLLQEEQGIDYDLVNAVLGENDPEYQERALKDPIDVLERAKFLQTIRQNQMLDKIYETVNRSTRLASQGTLNTTELNPENLIQPSLFQKSSEQGFYHAILSLVPHTKAAQQTRNYQQLVERLTEIAPQVSQFFDGPDSVLVMDGNPDIKQNRLHLLGLLRNHARVLADFGAIVKS